MVSKIPESAVRNSKNKSTNPNPANLDSLYKSALKFLEPISLEETYKKIVLEAIKLSGGNFGSLFLKETGKLERIYAHPASLHKNKIRKRGFTHRAFLKSEPSVVHIAQIEKLHPAVRDMGIKSTVYLPLINKGQRIGLIAVDFIHEREDFTKEVEVLKIFSSIAALGIRKAQLYANEQRALESRDLFISLASHELRTPLTIVLLYADLIEKSIRAGRIPNKKWADLVAQEAQHLRIMTDEFLSIDQIKSGQLQYEYKQVNFTRITKRAIHNFTDTHSNKVKIVSRIQEETEILADYDKMLQVITNILNNAAKYSQRGSTIEVLLTETKGDVYLSIKDYGIGIKKADLKKVFSKYYQSENPQTQGLGLGLYLAKVVVEMHRGKIKISSKVNIGTEIILKLPKLGKREK